MSSMPFFLNDQSTSTNNGKTNIIAGATGYIGKSTVRESVRQGYNTIALVRDATKVSSAEGKALYGQFFEGAKVVECDVCDPEALTKVGFFILKRMPFFFEIGINYVSLKLASWLVNKKLHQKQNENNIIL